MSKKFKNIENDEAFKNFKLEDYMPSMPKHEPEESSSVTEQEPVVEAGNLFPVLDEPETSEGSDNETKRIEADNVSVERTIARRISSKQRRLSLDEYRATFLRVPRLPTASPCSSVGRSVIAGRNRAPPRWTWHECIRLIENLARQHMEAYREYIEQWRKL